jgi:hypothetical protein
LFTDPILAGIIRISPDFAPPGVEGALAALFESWGHRDAVSASGPGSATIRLTGLLLGPRQHKVRANLDQIRAELGRALAGFQQYEASE